MNTKYIISLALVCMSIQLTKAQEQFSVYFESNKFELKPVEIKRLDNWLQENKNSKIVGVYGYCDEDGSVIFNDSLAKKRIDFVHQHIFSKIAMRSDYKTRNFGKLHQVSKIKSENRNVTLYYITSKDLTQEDVILGIKKPTENPVKISHTVVNYPPGIAIESPDGSVSKFQLDTVFMKKIAAARVGEKLKIEHLNFVINTFAVELESRVKLYELLMVLTKNPDLKIEIQGHLCCMPTDRLDLSTQRAKAVYRFLINNNIEKERLSYKGFGSTMPIFPLPEKDEKERAANRRVEIEIISN